MKTADGTERSIEDMSAEEFDAYLDRGESPKARGKKNGRARLLPLFVYLILSGNRGRHFTQKELIGELEKYPYEISVERKSLSRTIHALEEEWLGVRSAPKRGVWIS